MKKTRLEICSLVGGAADAAAAVGGVLFDIPRRRGRAYTEEELFELFREIAEAAPAKSVTVRLSLGENISTELRALLRGAVFGNFSVLFSSLYTMDGFCEGAAEIRRAFCELEGEGREFNGYINRGLCVDSPLLLCTADSDCVADFYILDLESLYKREDSDDTVLLGVKELMDKSVNKELSVIIDKRRATENMLSSLEKMGILRAFIK